MENESNREEAEEPFADDQGDQPFDPGDIALERGVITTPYDAPVRTLLDEIRDKTLIVNPQFQRQSVWDSRRKSRLVESLLLNIPIPVLYFAEDDDGTRVVVDGQQRLRAIEEFHNGQYRLAHLEVLAALNGKRWTDLDQKQSRTILTRTLRCVVVSAQSPANLRFEMFERLNTGGLPLDDQEIRNCVFRGSLNELLNELVAGKQWLSVVKKERPDNRLRHHELALRFFAVRHVLDDYKPPLKKILNDFMKSRRELTGEAIGDLRARFSKALANVQSVFGTNAFRRYRGRGDARSEWDQALNRAVFDVQMLSLEEMTPEDAERSSAVILETFQHLCLENSEFADCLNRATADRNRLYARLRIWGDALATVGIDVPYRDRLPAPIS